jgi:hypothetical protein
MRVHEFSIHIIEITSQVRLSRRQGRNQSVIKESDLRDMSAADRRQLARTLAAFDCPDPMLGLYISRRRRVGILFFIIACLALAAWIIVLVLTLHRSFHTHYWRGAWVGFDIIELMAFAATGWAFWRGRQVVIAFLLITGTLLCCDAWFDVILDSGTRAIWGSVASAVFIELPLAFLMFNAARRLIRISALAAVSEAGRSAWSAEDRRRMPIWKIPLAGAEAAVPEEHTGRLGETTDRSSGKSHSDRW